MSQEFSAVYEHGVLRPLTPLDLPEAAVVTGIVRQKGENAAVNSNDPLQGFMADDPDLVDAIVKEAMLARESYPFRTNG